MKFLQLFSCLLTGALLANTSCSITEEPTATDAIPTSITYTTTNFNDGWVATAKTDYVEVIKGNIEVRIYAPDGEVDKKIPPNMYSLDYAWSATVPPAFNVGQVQVRDKGQFSSGDNMWEAPVTDKQTGQSRYAGLTIRWNSGKFHTILVLAPNQNTYYQAFPNFESFERMLGYNPTNSPSLRLM